MKIGPIDTQSRDGSIECSAVVESHSGACAAQRVWFRVAEEHAALVDASTANAFVAGLFLAAMAAGEDVQASDPICPALGGNLWSMSRIVGTWPRTPSWRVRPMSVRIHGPTAPSGASIAPTGVGCFFTLGVDSLFALLNEPAIDHLIYVVGYDCPLSDRPLRAEIERRVHDVSVRTGRTAVIVETNLREFTEPLVSWPSNHGAALAAAGLFLGGGLQRVHIASSDAYITRAPYGTHPDIDPLWSSARTRFVSQGTGFTRLAKIGHIAKDPLFRENVRVCWANRPVRYNCRDCMKCLRTMLQLRHWGQLETCSTLAGPMPWHILDTAIEPQHRWFIWEDLLKGFADDDEGRAARSRPSPRSRTVSAGAATA